MNEIGLDPGDHMSAMKVIDEIEKGGKMLYSILCGGLLNQIPIVGIINSLGLPVM
jgi:hypothetical protein